MVAYLDRRGYSDFRECVDHALAALLVAETYEIEPLWVDAFAHAVGMHHGLHHSVEFEVSTFPWSARIPDLSSLSAVPPRP